MHTQPFETIGDRDHKPEIDSDWTLTIGAPYIFLPSHVPTWSYSPKKDYSHLFVTQLPSTLVNEHNWKCTLRWASWGVHGTISAHAFVQRWVHHP